MTSEDKAAIKAAAKATVDTFASLVGKKLSLRNGNIARTEGTTIIVPFKDEDPYLLVERQLAHVLFRSDSKSRSKFVSQFIHRTVRAAYREGIPATSLEPLQESIELIVDVLESRRIDSLWAMLYPGSSAKSKARLYKDARQLNSHESLLQLLVCLDSGRTIEEGPLSCYVATLEDALTRVERKGFEATLIAARRVVASLVTEYLKQLKPENVQYSTQERVEALRQLGPLLGQLPEDLKNRYSDYKIQEGEALGTDDLALSVDISKTSELDRELQASELRMAALLRSVQDKLTAPPKKDAWRDENPESATEVRVIKDNDRPLKALSLTEEDLAAVKKLRTVFTRLMSRQALRKDDSGSEIDVPSVIERRLTGAPVPCFNVHKPTQGFRVVLLVDRSGSMKGMRTAQVERASMILTEALKFPFVDLSVWGFQGFEGSTCLTKFNLKLSAFDTDHSLPVDGFTPLHIAVKASTQELIAGPSDKHLFILTDGGPYFVDRSGKEVSQKLLRAEVREAVLKARRCQIRPTTLIIGTRTSQGVVTYDVSPEHADYMFGEGHWQYEETESVGDDLVKAVTTSFTRYLRRG